MRRILVAKIQKGRDPWIDRKDLLMIQVVFLVLMGSLVSAEGVGPYKLKDPCSSSFFMSLVQSTRNCQGVYTRLKYLNDFLADPKPYMEGSKKGHDMNVVADAPRVIDEFLTKSSHPIADFFVPQGDKTGADLYKQMRDQVSSYADIRNIGYALFFLPTYKKDQKFAHFASVCKSCKDLPGFANNLDGCGKKQESSCQQLKSQLQAHEARLKGENPISVPEIIEGKVEH